MLIKLIPPQYIAAAINPATEYVQNWTNNYYYQPGMANAVGNSQYLLSKDNLPPNIGTKLNYFA